MSKVFCTKPFDHIYVHPNGKFRLCCTTLQDVRSNDGYTVLDASKHTIEQYWNSDRIKQIRTNMLNGIKTKDCQRCYQQEKEGIQSLRSNKDEEYYRKMARRDGHFESPATSMQLQMGNICNLKCKMCSQMYSHMNGLELLEMGKIDAEWLHWVKKQGANVNNWTNELGTKQEWYKNDRLKIKMFDYISNNIKDLCVIGGEPTLIPEFYELFEYCDSQGSLKDKSITLVTNLTNTNPRMTKWLPKLQRFSIWASVDGVKERTEYIRYPSRWNKILQSLDFYKQFLPGTSNNITLSPAVQLLNIDQLDDIIKWWKEYAGGDLNINYGFTWLATVWYPLICNPAIAPTDWRLRVADKLDDYQFDDVYKSLVTKLRNEYYTPEQGRDYQKSFIKFNDAQDKFRNVPITWRQLLPDLEKSLTESLR